MSKKLPYAAAALCAALSSVLAATATAQTPTQPSGYDRPDSQSTMRNNRAAAKAPTPQSFVTQVAVINKAEVELGQLALKNSRDSEVQKFAQRMITDHTNASKQLQSVAGKENLTLPQRLDTEHQALKDRLTPLKGSEFDREYSKAMLDGHEKAVALFEAAVQSGQLPSDLKEFASTTLPTLQQHRDMAHSVNDDSRTGKSDHHASDASRS